MFRILRPTLSSRWLFLLLLPTLCIGFFPSFFFKSSRPLGAVERERAITQLRTTIERASGKPSDEQLLYFERTYAKTRVAGLARFLRAYLHFKAADYVGSAPLFEDPVVKDETELGDYALYYQGHAYQELGDDRRAHAAFAQLADRYPESIFRREAQLAAAEISLKLGDPKAAFKLVAKLVEAKDPAALLLTAQGYEQFSGAKDAIAFYRKLYYELPNSEESETAAARLTALGIKLPETGKEGYKLAQTRADRLFEASQFARAAEAYTTLMTQFPDLAVQPRNSLRLGVSLYNQGRYRDALKSLLAVPSGEKDLYLDALYYTAHCYRRQHLMAQFVDAANLALAKHPPSNLGADLLAALIEYYEPSSETTAARFRAQLLKDYPQSKEADEASYRAVWRLQTEKRYEQASKALIEHLADFPNTEWRGMVAFWAGRDNERLGQPARAAAIYEAILRRYRYGYYGYLAEQHLAQLKRQQRDLKPEQPDEGSLLARALATIKPAAPLPETVTEKAEPRLARAESLQVISLGDLALAELEVARRDAPTSPRINLEIARIHHARGENLKAVLALQRAHPDYLLYQGNEVPRELFEIFFPLTEWKTIKTEATRYRLDPYLVAGLIRQESVFDPLARSRANALGLMQLLPSTGKLVARKQGSGKITAEQLYNPQLNIKLGVAYLADLVDRFGRIEYAAAAYNGGPARVDRWLQTLPNDLEDWIEAIPITETRLYVQGVIRNAAQYRRLYAE